MLLARLPSEISQADIDKGCCRSLTRLCSIAAHETKRQAATDMIRGANHEYVKFVSHRTTSLARWRRGQWTAASRPMAEAWRRPRDRMAHSGRTDARQNGEGLPTSGRASGGDPSIRLVKRSPQLSRPCIRHHLLGPKSIASSRRRRCEAEHLATSAVIESPLVF
jgi:hypothetical protein